MGARSISKLVYIDDSGDPSSGIAVFGWVEFPPDRWADVLGAWLAHRKRLTELYRVPVTEELHMTEFVLGRGRISTAIPEKFISPDGQELWKDLGAEVAVRGLETMKSMEGLQIGAVFRRGDEDSLHETKSSLYAALLSHFEKDLEQTDSLGLVFMDGDGTDRIYRDAHRNLPLSQRRVLEDPIFLDSKSSQLVQMADHVAWCAKSAVVKIPKHAFAHDWYEDYLSERDIRREPIQL